ncbi:unnamed protein product, partial [Amoebophrya sp. A25]
GNKAELWKSSGYTLFTQWQDEVEAFHLPPDRVPRASVACLQVGFCLTSASVIFCPGMEKLSTGNVYRRNNAARIRSDARRRAKEIRANIRQARDLDANGALRNVQAHENYEQIR